MRITSTPRSSAAALARVRVRDLDLAYRRSGTDEARLPVLYSHGLAQSQAIEDGQPLIRWHRVGAPVVRYDARGHGETIDDEDASGRAPGASSAPEDHPFSWRSLALDQLALADALGVDRYIAAGASMGAGTALWAATLQPSRVAGLVLVIPPTAWQTRAEQTAQWAAAGDLVERHGVEALVRANRLKPVPDPLPHTVAYAEGQAVDTRSWSADRLARVLRGAAHADLPPREAVARIACPTLILSWSGDPTHPRETAHELSTLIAGSEWYEARDAAAFARWTRVVDRFVRGVSRVA